MTGLRERFAQIIDPEAFDQTRTEGVRWALEERRAIALGKADEILSCEASIEDLENAGVAGVVEAIDNLAAVAEVSAARVPAMIGGDGRPIYNALVKPMPGSLLVMVLISERETRDEEDSPWAIQSLESEEALRFGAEIEVYAAGGGSA